MSNRAVALIENGRVYNVIAASAVHHGESIAVDVTDLSPRPQVNWRFDGETFTPPPPFSRDEATIKAEAIAIVNVRAGDYRAQFVTNVPGQAETYLLKADELKAFDESFGTIDPASVPILSAEAAATGMNISAVADLVRSTRTQWVQLAAYVEGKRRGAIVAIERATSESDVWAAVPAVWP